MKLTSGSWLLVAGCWLLTASALRAQDPPPTYDYDPLCDIFLGVDDDRGFVHRSRLHGFGASDANPEAQIRCAGTGTASSTPIIVLTGVGMHRNLLLQTNGTTCGQSSCSHGDHWNNELKDDEVRPAPHAAHYFVSRTGRIYRLLNEGDNVKFDNDFTDMLSQQIIVIAHDLGPEINTAGAETEAAPADRWNLPGSWAQKKWDARPRMVNASANLVAFLCAKYNIRIRWTTPFMRQHDAADGSNDGGTVRDVTTGLTALEAINYTIGATGKALEVIERVWISGEDETLDKELEVQSSALVEGGITGLSTFNIFRTGDNTQGKYARYYYGPDGAPSGGRPAGAFPEQLYMLKVRGYWWAVSWQRDFLGHKLGFGISAFCGIKLPKPQYKPGGDPPITLKAQIEASGEIDGTVWILGNQIDVVKVEAWARMDLLRKEYDVQGWYKVWRWRRPIFTPEIGNFRQGDENPDVPDSMVSVNASWRWNNAPAREERNEWRHSFWSTSFEIPIAGIVTLRIGIEAGEFGYYGLGYILHAEAALTAQAGFQSTYPYYKDPYFNIGAGGQAFIKGGGGVYVKGSVAISILIFEIGLQLNADLMNVELRAGPQCEFRLYNEGFKGTLPYRISFRSYCVIRPINVTISVYVDVDLWVLGKHRILTIVVARFGSAELIWNLQLHRESTTEDMKAEEDAEPEIMVVPASLSFPAREEEFIYPKVVPEFRWRRAGYSGPHASASEGYPYVVSWTSTFVIQKEGPYVAEAPQEFVIDAEMERKVNDFLTKDNSQNARYAWAIRSVLVTQEMEDDVAVTRKRIVQNWSRFVHLPPTPTITDQANYGERTNRIRLGFPDYRPGAGQRYQIERVGTDGTIRYFEIIPDQLVIEYIDGVPTVVWIDDSLDFDHRYTYRIRTQHEQMDEGQEVTVDGLWSHGQSFSTHPAEPRGLHVFLASSGDNHDIAHLYWHAGRRYGAWHTVQGSGDRVLTLSEPRMDLVGLSGIGSRTHLIAGGRGTTTTVIGSDVTEWIGENPPYHAIQTGLSLSQGQLSPSGTMTYYWGKSVPFGMDTVLSPPILIGQAASGTSPLQRLQRKVAILTETYQWKEIPLGASWDYPPVQGGHLALGLVEPLRYGYPYARERHLPAAMLIVGGRGSSGDTEPRKLTLVTHTIPETPSTELVYSANNCVRTVEAEEAAGVSFYTDGTEFTTFPREGSYGFITGGATRRAGVVTPLNQIICVRVDDLHDSKVIGDFTYEGAVGIPPMLQARAGHTATLFNSKPLDWMTNQFQWLDWRNRIAVIGGCDDPRIEIYDLATNTWTHGPVLKQNRKGHRTLKLANGRLLIVGGTALPGGDAPAGAVLSSCEIYDPFAGEWGTVHSGELLDYPVCRFALTGHDEDGGSILLAGGFDGAKVLDRLRMYQPNRYTVSRRVALRSGPHAQKTSTVGEYSVTLGMALADDLKTFPNGSVLDDGTALDDFDTEGDEYAMPDGSIVTYWITTHGIYGNIGFKSDPVSVLKGLRGPTRIEVVEGSLGESEVTLRPVMAVPPTISEPVTYVLERLVMDGNSLSLFSSDLNPNFNAAFMKPAEGSVLTEFATLPERVTVTDLGEGGNHSFRFWAKATIDGTTWYSPSSDTLSVTMRPGPPVGVTQSRDIQQSWAVIKWEDGSAHESGYVVEDAVTGVELAMHARVDPLQPKTDLKGDPVPLPVLPGQGSVRIEGLTPGVSVAVRVRAFTYVESNDPGAEPATERLMETGLTREVYRLYSREVSAGGIDLPPDSAFAVGDWSKIGGSERTGWRIFGPVGSRDIPVTAIAPASLAHSEKFGFEGSYQVAATLTPGHGYWVKSSAGVMWQAEGAECSGPVTLHFQQGGWKLLANPYNFDLLWKDSYAPTRSGNVFVYRSNGYEVLSDGGTLRKFEGFWIKINPGTVTFQANQKR